MADKIGIDVSEHNGALDWKKIKCDFALIRGGYGSGDVDKQFLNNVMNCQVPFGVYWFSYSSTVAGAIVEADKCLETIKKTGKKPTLPIFYDWEYDSDRYCREKKGVVADRALYTAMAKAFMDHIRAAGYEAGNYYNHDYYKKYCGTEILDRKKYRQWYAYYGDTCSVDCDIWQYTEKGSVTGFNGDVNKLLTALLKEKPAPAPSPKPQKGNPNSRVLQTGKNQITNPFGNGHGGIDVVKETNQLDEITAHTAGTVTFCQTGIPNDQGSSGNRSYGNCVKIKHQGGCSTLYAHLNSVKVTKGAQVKEGQVIGTMGNTGNSYGAHLHFEVRDHSDDRVDPKPYLNANLPGEKTNASPTPKYKTGSYRVTAHVLTVRKSPALSAAWVPYEKLTPNAKAQIQVHSGGQPNGYVQGMVCDVSKVSGSWGKTPSGWICLDYCKKA